MLTFSRVAALLVVLLLLLPSAAIAQEPLDSSDASPEVQGALTAQTGYAYPLGYGFQAEGLAVPPEAPLDAIVAAGFNWDKQQIRWASFEPAPGQIDWEGLDRLVDAANARGVNLLLSVVTAPQWTRSTPGENGPPDDFGELARFMGELAARYAGRVQAYEVWNEQNLAREWADWPLDAGTYVDLLAAASGAIRAADPNAIVVSGALTPTGVNDGVVGIDDVQYLSDMYAYRDGLILSLVDAIGAHATGYNNAPEDSPGFSTVNTPGFKDHSSFFFTRLDELQAVKAAFGDPDRPVWVTEYEWASVRPPVPPGYEWTTHLTEGQAAQFLVEGIQSFQQWRTYVGAVFVWNLNWRSFQDPRQSEQAIFGVLNADLSPRPMYTALANMEK